MDPEEFAGRCVERDNRPSSAGRRVEHPTDHQRRAFELVFGAGAETIGLEAPRDLEVLEVLRRDLVEWRIAAAARVARVAWPLAVLGGRNEARRRWLAREACAWPNHRSKAECEQKANKRCQPPLLKRCQPPSLEKCQPPFIGRLFRRPSAWCVRHRDRSSSGSR